MALFLIHRWSPGFSRSQVPPEGGTPTSCLSRSRFGLVSPKVLRAPPAYTVRTFTQPGWHIQAPGGQIFQDFLALREQPCVRPTCGKMPSKNATPKGLPKWTGRASHRLGNPVWVHDEGDSLPRVRSRTRDPGFCSVTPSGCGIERVDQE